MAASKASRLYPDFLNSVFSEAELAEVKSCASMLPVPMLSQCKATQTLKKASRVWAGQAMHWNRLPSAGKSPPAAGCSICCLLPFSLWQTGPTAWLQQGGLQLWNTNQSKPLQHDANVRIQQQKLPGPTQRCLSKTDFVHSCIQQLYFYIYKYIYTHTHITAMMSLNNYTWKSITYYSTLLLSVTALPNILTPRAIEVFCLSHLHIPRYLNCLSQLLSHSFAHPKTFKWILKSPFVHLYAYQALLAGNMPLLWRATYRRGHCIQQYN